MCQIRFFEKNIGNYPRCSKCSLKNERTYEVGCSGECLLTLYPQAESTKKVIPKTEWLLFFVADYRYFYVLNY